jgi:hypothetical protein
MIGEKGNPAHVKVETGEMPVAKMVVVAIISLAPVAVAILMQNPALRQALQLRAWNGARTICRKNQAMWAKFESIAATHYDIARL